MNALTYHRMRRSARSVHLVHLLDLAHGLEELDRTRTRLIGVPLPRPQERLSLEIDQHAADCDARSDWAQMRQGGAT